MTNCLWLSFSTCDSTILQAVQAANATLCECPNGAHPCAHPRCTKTSYESSASNILSLPNYPCLATKVVCHNASSLDPLYAILVTTTALKYTLDYDQLSSLSFAANHLSCI